MPIDPLELKKPGAPASIILDGKVVGLVQDLTPTARKTYKKLYEIHEIQEPFDLRTLKEDYELLSEHPDVALVRDIDKVALQEIQHTYAMDRFRG